MTIEGGAGPPAPYEWSPDGQSLLFEFEPEGSGSTDIGIVLLGDSPTWEPLLATDAEEGAPTISPDGGWLAYHSDQTGRREIYIQRFPELGGREQVSTGRGMDPVWTADGRGLFFRSGRARPPAEVSVVPIETEPELMIGTPVVLFEKQYYRTLGSMRRFDRAPDDRLLMIDSGTLPTEQADQVIFVQHWFEERKERVPVP